jgi:hypothetical protein
MAGPQLCFKRLNDVRITSVLVFRVVTPCEIAGRSQRFGEIYCAYVQPVWTCSKIPSVSVAHNVSIFRAEHWDGTFLRNVTYPQDRAVLLPNQHRYLHRRKNLKSQTQVQFISDWDRKRVTDLMILWLSGRCTQNLKDALWKYRYPKLMSIFARWLILPPFKKLPDKGRVAFQTGTDALKPWTNATRSNQRLCAACRCVKFTYKYQVVWNRPRSQNASRRVSLSHCGRYEFSVMCTERIHNR